MSEPLESAQALIEEGLRQREQHGAASALRYFERAAQLEPDSHLPFLMLGNVAADMSDFDRAAECYGRARDLAPKNHVVRYNLGLSHLSRGHLEAAIGELAAACYLNPSYPAAQSAFIMALHYSDQLSPGEIAVAIREWGARFPPATPYTRTDPEIGSRLRVGFISGDFRTHSVAHFFEPIVSARNRAAFEYILYSSSIHKDGMTERLRESSDAWHDVAELSDDVLTDLIRAHRVDILVDLSGHTEGNRLAVFARRAAPVQVTYLGFPNSTGLANMDFRITDGITDPGDLADGWHTERLLRLPDSQWCFRPFGMPPAPGPLPARKAGFITFGSFNNLTKAGDTILGCWAQILMRVPASRLRLARVLSATRAAEILAFMETAGVSSDRIDCTAFRSEIPYGLQFDGIDISLDPYPYNGVTTSCESLFVGVPVISLHGQNCVSRSGLSILSTLGLRELVASSPQEYVEIAVTLALDRTRLEELRGGLRDRFERSALRNEKLFAAHFEELLLTAWRERPPPGVHRG